MKLYNTTGITRTRNLYPEEKLCTVLLRGHTYVRLRIRVLCIRPYLGREGPRTPLVDDKQRAFERLSFM